MLGNHIKSKKKKRVFFCLFYQDHVINLHPPNNCPNSTLILLFNLAAPAAPSLLSSPGNVFSKADTAPPLVIQEACQAGEGII